MRNNADELVPLLLMPPVPRTELGMELFELMQEPSGATPEAIRACPGLMGLNYIRAEAPVLRGADEQGHAVAVTVVECIVQATLALDKPIRQREHTDADRGAAARYLLALEQGTASMLLAGRRKRAARALDKKVETLIHQHKKDGRVETYETWLMDAVARLMMAREVDHLRSSSSKEAAERERGEPWLQLVHKVWEVAGDLNSSVKIASGLPTGFEDMYPRERDMESLHDFGLFWKLVSRPEQDAIDAIRAHRTAVVKLLPLGWIAEMYVLQPFPYETIEHLTASLIVGPYVGSTQVMCILLKPWRIWLESCRCPAGNANPDCKVHRFCATLREYRKQTEECWEKLRDPHSSPDTYRSKRTPEEWLDWYCIASTIDKSTMTSI